jgi:sulfate adenylyltransferase subunit 2
MKDLISKSTYILREAKSRFKKPAVLWSTGKDSTAMLYLIKQTFGNIPFPVVHIDTGFKPPEVYKFRDKISKKWNLNLVIAGRDNTNFGPDKVDHFICCNELKTKALQDVLKKHKFDALIMSIRRDEHYMRNLERTFSPRDKQFKWHIVRMKKKEEIGDGDTDMVSEQHPELWDLYQTDFGSGCNHVRVHPILHWTEIDVWEYIKKYKIPFNPLYLSKKGRRYRSLGCQPCTAPVSSDAKNVDEIIEELKTTDIGERSGRAQNKENEDIFRRLRSLGYM